MNKGPAAGFTLLEVLIAIVVIAIGFLGTASLMSGTVGGNANALAVSGATRVAADQLEILISLNFNHPDLQDGQVDPLDPAFGINGLRNPLPRAADLLLGVQDRPDPVARPADFGPFPTPDNNYSIYWNIANNQPMLGTKTIMVVVTSTGLGPQKTVALQRIISSF